MNEKNDPAIIKAAEALVDLRRDDFGDTLPYDMLEPMEQEYHLAQARVVAAIVRASPAPPTTEGREAIRREALEEASALFENAAHTQWTSSEIADAIRALSPPVKDKP